MTQSSALGQVNSYVPYNEPTTGTRHMLPMAIAVRLNEDDKTHSKATAAPTGFFENVIPLEEEAEEEVGD